MSFGVTASGFKTKRLADIKVEIEEKLRATFGKGIDLSPENFFGQVVGIFAEREALVWEKMEGVYHSQYPYQASDVSLDNVVSITGTVRKQATFSSLTLTMFGDPQTEIPAGTVVSAEGAEGDRFVTSEIVTIDDGINEVQQISFGSLPVAGSYTLAFDGEITASLVFNSSATDIKIALEALPNIDQVAVSGSFLLGFLITFLGSGSAKPRPSISISTNALESSEKTRITTVADVGGDLHRTSFDLYDENGSVGVYLDNGSGGGAPAEALALDRQLAVAYNDNDSSSAIASAIATALSLDAEFSAVANANAVEVENVNTGARTNATDNDTNFTFLVLRDGYDSGSLPVTISKFTEGALPSASVVCFAEESGPVVAPSGAVTTIETPVQGLDSVINLEDANVGQAIESDTALLQRRDSELAVSGRATVPALKARLLEIPEVIDALVFLNNTAIEDADGRPPNSLDIVVVGGSNEDIAQTIFETAAGGIGFVGSEVEQVTDADGFLQTVQFSRPALVPIYLEVDLSTDTDVFPDDGEAQAAVALKAFGDSLEIGQDVVVYPQLLCAFAHIPGITDVIVRIGKAVGPSLDDNIAIAAREIADFDSSRITVVEL